MNKLAKTASVLMAGLAISVSSCSDKTASADAAGAQAVTVQGAEASGALNIRYIDMDTLMTRYAYAKDFQDVVVRTDERIERARQAKAAEIQKFAQQMEQKYRNNGYLSEASFVADQQKLQKMQEDAESTLGTMARNAQIDLAQQQQALTDSIENYVKAYNKTRGYDAILYKAAGIFFNPALDITDEVVKGLNDSYNKVGDNK